MTATQLTGGTNYTAGLTVVRSSSCSASAFASSYGKARRGNGLCTSTGFSSQDYWCSGTSMNARPGSSATTYVLIKNENSSSCTGTTLTVFAAMSDIGSGITTASSCSPGLEDSACLTSKVSASEAVQLG